MLHAYYVLKKRLQRIQQKNADFIALLTHKFPFIHPTSSQHALILRSPHRAVPRAVDGDSSNQIKEAPLLSSPLLLSPAAGLPSFYQQSPRSLALLSPRAAARLAQSTSASATLSLLSALHLLSTRCTRLTLHRHHTLLSSADNKDLIYIVHTGQLTVLRPSNVRTEEQEERNEPEPTLEWLHLARGDDIGLYDLILELRTEHRRREAREKAQKARLKREEQEWERIKQAGLVTKEMNFLRAKKTRDEQRRQSVLLSQQLLDAAEEAEERRREADRQQQRWPFSVVARQTSVVYVVSRAAVRECMREQTMLCLRMCEWMEETEAWRQARWQHLEQQRAAAEEQRRADGHLTATQPGQPLPHTRQQLPSWQSAHQRSRDRERESRDRYRREEEKKRNLDDTMHALHSSSVAMLTAVAGEEAASGLGRAVSRSREEMDVVMMRARVDAELLKEAMKKRALLTMFRSDAQDNKQPKLTTMQVGQADKSGTKGKQGEAKDKIEQSAEQTEEDSDATTLAQARPAQASDGQQSDAQPAEAADEDDNAELSAREQQTQQLTIALSQARTSVSLPPLRLDLLPPPSPISDASTASAIDASASASPFAPSPNGLMSPMFSSTGASSMDTSAACSPSAAYFILPKTPMADVGGGSQRQQMTFSFAQYKSPLPPAEQKEALVEVANSFDRTALLPSVSSGAAASGSGASLGGVWQASRPRSVAASDEQMRFLMLQLLYQPRPAPAPQLAARRQQPIVLIPQLAQHTATSVSSSASTAEQLTRSRRLHSKQHRVERLAQQMASYWHAEDARLKEQQQLEQDALRHQLVSELRRRRQLARNSEDRQRKRDEAEAQRLAQREADERKRREEQEHESFNFVNMRANKGPAALAGAGSGVWSFLTQHGEGGGEEAVEDEAEADGQGERAVRMYDSDGSGPSSVRSVASRTRDKRGNSALQLPSVVLR